METYLDTIRNITNIATSSSVATEIFGHLARRKNRRKVETVRRLIQICGSGTRRGEVVAVLRQLESIEFGQLIVGRHGHESRFEWTEIRR